jgi:hypothetical protein
MQKCQRCRGTKKVMGLGWIEKDCNVCGATGYVKDEVKLADKVLKDAGHGVESVTIAQPVVKQSKRERVSA